MLWSPSATGHFKLLPALRSGPREALAGEAGSGDGGPLQVAGASGPARQRKPARQVRQALRAGLVGGLAGPEIGGAVALG